MQFNQFRIGLWTKKAIKSGEPIKLLVYIFDTPLKLLTFIALLFRFTVAFMALELL